MAPSRSRKAQSAFVPGPIGGWNARDPVSAMAPTDAVQMVNWFPDTDLCKVRNGYSSWATAIDDPVESLLEYAGIDGSELFAAAGENIFNVSSSGDVGTADVDSLSNARWQATMHSTSGGQFLFAVNGEDEPLTYDGTSWDTPTFTGSGFTSTAMVDVTTYQERIWMVEKDTLDAWYLGPQAISGAAAKFPLGAVARRGGYLVGISTWSRDAGSGPSEYIIFVTSEGEVIEYAGIDPTDPTDFHLTGVYRIGRPVGNYRCVTRVGSDTLITCEDGVYPLSKLLITGQTRQDVAISDKIRGAFQAAAAVGRSFFGWQGCLYPRGRYLLFNVPTVSGATSDQYVMNTITGAWCRFTAQNAFCWATFNGNLYFGGDGAVYKADSGYDDNGGEILGILQPAYNYYGNPTVNKLFTLVRPIFISVGDIRPAMVMCTDFSDLQPTSVPSYSGTGGSPWDTSPWNTTPWEPQTRTLTAWQSVTGMGFAGSLKIKTSSKNFGVALSSYQVSYLPAGNLM